MKEPKKSGGRREGSGRKPSIIIKKPITLYVPEFKVQDKETRKGFISECYKLIEKYL